jgi:glycosyltransferase involved in cell wall biosynthesis
MRLLLIVEEENLGGAELSFLELARALAAHTEVHLAVGARAMLHHSAAYDDLPRHGVVLHPCRTALYPGTLANLHRRLRAGPARELAWILEGLNPAAVLVNMPTVERGQSAADAVRGLSFRPPLWGLVHLVQPPSRLGACLGWARDLMVPALLKRFDLLLAVSHSGARQLSSSYGLKPAAVLHPPTTPLRPVPDPVERDRQRGHHGWPPGFLLGMVGRVQLRQKGHDAGLRVAAQLVQRGLPVHLLIIGDGPDLSVVRQQAEQLGIAGRTSFLGWRHDAADLIPLLDAVLLPSHFEGLPQTALQAATAGVPVIAYDVDGLTELLPPAFRVPHGHEAELANAVSELMEGTRRWPREEMARRASEWGNPELGARTLLQLLEGAEVYTG